jgi:hypothetical protein
MALDQQTRDAFAKVEALMTEAGKAVEEVEGLDRDHLLEQFASQALALAMVRGALQEMSDAAEALVADLRNLPATQQLAYNPEVVDKDAVEAALATFEKHFEKGV